MDYLTIVLLILLFLIILYEIQLRLLPSYRAAKQFPGPRPLPLLGNAFSLLFNDQVSSFYLPRRWAQEFHASYALLVRGGLILNAIRARETEALLSSSRLIDKSVLYTFLRPFMGVGLLNSTGQKWFHRRKILTSAFHFNILPKFLVTFQEECEKLVEQIDKDVQKRKETTLQLVAARFTLNTICETAMGVKLDSMTAADDYRANIQDVVKLLLLRVMNPWLMEDFTYAIFGFKARLVKALEPIHGFTRAIIKQRRQLFHANVKNLDDFSEENIYLNTIQRYALLDTLLASEARDQIDEEGIREEVDTFMFRGHDTTASAFTFIFLLLANHQDVQQQVFNEIESFMANRTNRDAPLSMADYNELKLLDRVIRECLRLYPPVPFISRLVTENTWFEYRFIPKDTMINVHIFDVHRDPVQFPEPERFDPDRFLPENVEKRNPYAYVPFSAGPRNCIGQRFAMLELKSILVSVLRRFRVFPVTKPDEVVFVADMVLRSKDPIIVEFERRLGCSARD
ncbi:probable cytochrome P450 4ac1 [Toxorhynchites rutilus septentrionalis]|uniref:probable cytochrome P450 4ac1 n=1 Tax=Toxorhynchites rutilus septentrionalis TaxID=329112 RepID=UPI0024790E35|nr:probable cytochrome P450 4ac1 [Toxorhynchites rutilus septentrionalis]